MVHVKAEFILGTDVINDNKRRTIEITTNMLDYQYVEKCNDVVTLKEILRELVAGKEGRYPHLEATVVEKIMALLPEKKKKKILSMTTLISPQEVESEIGALNDWLNGIQVKLPHEDDLMSTSGEPNNDSTEAIFSSGEEVRDVTYHPPVRNCEMKTKRVTSKIMPVQKDMDSSKAKSRNENVKIISKETHSNRDYFRAWDKFDYEAAEKELEEDNDDQQEDSQTDRKWEANIQKQKTFDLKQLQDLQSELNVSKLSITERKFMASREKDKGNEYFKNKEYEQSFNCYSKSLALNDQNAVVYANRAMTCIRLSKLCQAVSDCSQALMIDPHYTKALARRGMVHHKCGRYYEAKMDFNACVEQDPENKEYQQLLKKSSDKHAEVNGLEKHEKSKKKIVIIQEDDSDSDCDDVEEIYTPGALKAT